MDHRLIGEFMGTLVLVAIGNGTVANVVLRKALGENSGWIVICTGFAVAVMAGVFTAIAFGSGDAHINPAVTLGVGIITGDFSKLVPYTLAQILGAMAGATLVWLHFLPHWKETPEAARKLACFSTGPAIRSRGANLISEAIGTFFLVLVIVSIFSQSVSTAFGKANSVAPFLVGAVVWGIGLGMGGTTGFAINPARDLGPRIVHTILPISGKGDSDWGYAPVPVIGGFVGGALAGILVKLVL